jgi:hypothetical protein
MALRAEFSLINSELNAFLFASIGDEENGMELTVLSALSRLAIDPWGEAGRLSGLPKEAAASALASMIARLPRGRWVPSDIPVIAARLVQLLPERAAASPSRRSGMSAGGRWNGAALWLLVLVLLTAFALMWSLRMEQAPGPASAPHPSQHEQNRP